MSKNTQSIRSAAPFSPSSKSSLLLIAACSLLALAAGCGGGGGGSDNDSSDGSGTTTIPANACEVVARQAPVASRTSATTFPKVVNGNDCGSDRSPVVGLADRDSGGGLGSQFCSGTVIAPHTVLTAGHCLVDGHGLTTGAVNLFVVDGAGNNFTAADVNVHPVFKNHVAQTGDFTNAPNDIAIVTTDQDMGLRSLPILTSREAQSNEEGIVSGYGSTGENGPTGVQGTLQAGHVDVVGEDSTFITTLFNGDNSNSCFGDSGGPLLLIQNNTFAIAGTVSQGTKDHCEAGDVTTYPNLSDSSNLSFLQQAATEGFATE